MKLRLGGSQQKVPVTKKQPALDPNAIVIGFCYAYTTALLEKLKELRRNDSRCFLSLTDGYSGGIYDRYIFGLNTIASALVDQIKKQTSINFESPDRSGSWVKEKFWLQRIDYFIEDVELFLSAIPTKKRP